MNRKVLGRRVTVAATAATVTALVLTACASGDAEPTDSGTPVAGGDLTYALQGYPSCLDVQQSISNSTAGEQVVDNLVAQDMDTGETVPWLASSVDVEDDGATYVLHLRDDVTFSNGEAFDASVVKANFDNIVEMGFAKAYFANTYLNGYVGTEVVDEYTAKVTFDEPKAGFMEAMAEKTLGMVAPESLAQTTEERCAEGVIGSGPFVIDEVVQDQRIVEVKRDDYAWPSGLASHDGAAYLDTLTFEAIPEQSVRTGSLVSGDVDVIPQIGPTDIAQLEAVDATLDPIYPGSLVQSILPNLNSDIAGDDAVRQAMQIGIDRQEIVDTLYTEYDAPAASVLGRAVPGFIDLSDDLTFDADAAAALLEDDGWVMGDDGVREKDGQPLEFSIMYSWAPYDQTAQLVQQQLAELGMSVELELLDYSAYTERRGNGNWDFVMTNSGTSDPDVLVPTFASYSGGIFAQFPVAELDDALLAQSQETDATARDELAADVQEIIIENAYGIPTVDNTWIYAMLPTVHGVYYTVPGMPVFYDTYIS